ncbi:MAG: hypothetical protein NC453_24645 [Muribaculum sp.]|nr:hypothetical protein [Muribaculum sp.]
MKRLLFNILLLLIIVEAVATEPNDSVDVAKALDEVVVIGENQRAEAGKLSFNPTNTQKKAATDGYALLRQLGITQLYIKPDNNDINTITGEAVALYVNGLPAQSYEIETLNTKDVIRVEYLESPSDPRYSNNKHVINFIVKVPESGGYVRADIESTSSLFRDKNVSDGIFARYVYKKFTYDFVITNYEASMHHDYINEKEYFLLVNSDNTSYNLEKTLKAHKTRSTYWNIPVTFNLTYNSDKFQFQNQVNFLTNRNPHSESLGDVSLSSYDGSNYMYSDKSSFMKNWFNWYSFYIVDLGDGFSLMAAPTLLHRHNKDFRNYSTDIPGNSDIITNSRENIWYLDVQAQLQKQINERHSVFIYLNTDNTWDNIDYTGTSIAASKLNNYVVKGEIGYNAFFPFNLRLKAVVGVNWIKNFSDGYKNIDLTPTASINGSYSPNNHHQVNLSFAYGENSVGASMRSDNIIQNSEYMYFTGNPNLKPYNYTDFKLTYTWLPANSFYATAALGNYTEFKTIYQCYNHYHQGEAIIRSYKEDGRYSKWFAALNLTYKPIKNLQLEGMLQYAPAKRTGADAISVKPITANLNARYYLKKFYFSAGYYFNGKGLSPVTNTIYNLKDFYLLSGGWSNENWHVDVALSNFFRNSYKQQVDTVKQNVYSCERMNFSWNNHRALTISVSYTFSFGKKVSHNNEANMNTSSGGQSVESGVLK